MCGAEARVEAASSDPQGGRSGVASNFLPSPEEALKSLRGAMAGYPHLRRLMDDLDDALKV
jgi:hypothetical protein